MARELVDREIKKQRITEKILNSVGLIICIAWMLLPIFAFLFIQIFSTFINDPLTIFETIVLLLLVWICYTALFILWQT